MDSHSLHLFDDIPFESADPSDEESCDLLPTDDLDGFVSMQEYLESWFQLTRSIYTFRERIQERFPLGAIDPDDASKRKRLRTQIASSRESHRRELDTLLLRSRRHASHFPFEQLCRKLELGENERLIITHVLMNEMSRDRCQVKEIATLLAKDNFDVGWERHLQPSSTLLLNDLIRIEEGRRRMRYGMRSEVKLRPAVRDFILYGKGNPVSTSFTADNSTPFVDNEDFLRTLLRYITMRIRFAGGDELSFDADDEAPSYELLTSRHSSVAEEQLEKLSASIEKRADLSNGQFPLRQLVREHDLSSDERDILLVLLDAEICQRGVITNEVSRVLGDGINSKSEILKLLSSSSKLSRASLIEVSPSRFNRTEVRLSTRAFDFIMGRGDGTSFTIKDVIADDVILSLVEPVHTLDDLVLPEDIMSVLRNAVDRYESKADETLRRWGLLPAQTEDGQCAHGSLLCLFHGSSGCGKTMAGEAFANALGRDLLTTDISKLLSAWVGESQQNVVRLFDRYEEIAQRMEKPPVLLLNEADQFLGRRTVRSEHSVDKMFSQMQNLFLERMERFQGILIATTNLVEGLDEAFSRRFDYKLRFPLPDAEARLEIWKKHLPASVPLDRDVDLERLASEFAFTGGQIAVATKNACLRAAVRGDIVRMVDLREACSAEKMGAFDSKTTSRKHSVGFCAW